MKYLGLRCHVSSVPFASVNIIAKTVEIFLLLELVPHTEEVFKKYLSECVSHQQCSKYFISLFNKTAF